MPHLSTFPYVLLNGFASQCINYFTEQGAYPTLVITLANIQDGTESPPQSLKIAETGNGPQASTPRPSYVSHGGTIDLAASFNAAQREEVTGYGYPLHCQSPRIEANYPRHLSTSTRA